MILAIEGAPGVGKSTTAAALGREGAFVIAEVNLLFAKPDPEPANWYYDRQNARWEMARLKSAQGKLSVLDGDPFQPVWFGWIFHPEGGSPPLDAVAFYRSRIVERRMAFPERYVFVHIAEEERRRRMLTRERARGLGEDRAQRKTAFYARMVQPQMDFFSALAERFPNWVLFVETTSLDDSVAAIRSDKQPRHRPESLEVIDFIADWVATRSPAIDR